MSKQRTTHHISFHFGKSRVLFSVPSTTTLLDLKKTLLSALPMLTATTSGIPGLSAQEIQDMGLPPPSSAPGGEHTAGLDTVASTADIVLWRARRANAETMDRFDSSGSGGGEGDEWLGWVCLEGDVAAFEEERGGEERGERRRVLDLQIRDLGMPVWDRWVDVYVSFRDGDGYPEPVVHHPSLDDGEYDEGDV